jgi:putative alpha-1,2-mannosidase
MRGPLRKFVSIAALCLVATASVKSQPKPVYTKYVNTFIGTAPLNDPKILGYELPKGWRSWAGLTFPGSSLPNAMVQLSPVTEYGSGAGYEYEDSVILGFTHTNKGHWNLCNIPILPVSGATGKFGSRFTHKKESSAPGFYQVYLDDYKVDVKLTSTLRCGYHQYSYQNNTNRQILFDLGKANSRVTTWNIKQVGDNAVQGFQGGENVYFYAVINTKIKSLAKTDEGKRTGNALITLADGGTGPVELKIGLSFVSAENAKQNLEKEIGDKSFETIRKEATQNMGKTTFVHPGKRRYG